MARVNYELVGWWHCLLAEKVVCIDTYTLYEEAKGKNEMEIFYEILNYLLGLVALSWQNVSIV